MKQCIHWRHRAWAAVVILLCYSCSAVQQRTPDDLPFAIEDRYAAIKALRQDFPFYQLPLTHDADMFNFVRFAAGRDNHDAQYLLGLLYWHGEGTERQVNHSIRWMREAAKHHHDKAQLFLGYLAYQGEEVVRHYGVAEQWFKLASANGNDHAKWYLANMYLKGLLGYHDDVKAFELFEELAHKGHRDAQFYMGKFYFHGRVVEKNMHKAKNWLQKAADHNHKEAKKMLRHIRQKEQTPPRDREEMLARLFH